ncbi:hypothetical protein [Candidatus Palauibacter sp.]|uniref:hypothetical protein n=1 Tax=Candidatus Palauibacter sp. TaxID=3101350 RepID=UPI003B523783
MGAPRRLSGGAFVATMVLACAAPAPDEGIGEVPEWTLQRGLAIGSPDDPVYGLWAVGGVLADEDRVYVVLARDGTIRIFTRDGEFVRDLGGRGSGPGELTLPTTLGWSEPGILSIGDSELRRFTFYEVATGEARTIPYHAYSPQAHGAAPFIPVVVLPDLRAAAAPRPSEAAPEHGILTTVPMVVLDTAGALLDTLALLSVQISRNVTAGVVADGRVRLGHPVRQGDKWRFAPDRSSIVVVDVEGGTWAGEGPAEFGVTMVDSNGDTLFHRRIAYVPRPVPDGYYDDEIEKIGGYRDADEFIADQRAFTNAVREFYEQTRYFPPVTNVVVGSDGTAWIAGLDEDGEREWLVLDASGASIGRFRLPTGWHVGYGNRNEAWVVERDALDIPYVVRYEIVR